MLVWFHALFELVFPLPLFRAALLCEMHEIFLNSFPYVSENWFSVDEKPPIAYARVEILEGADMKPSDPNGNRKIYKTLKIRSHC